MFKELTPFESDGRTARQGLATADNFRFIRCWWEVVDSKSWIPLAKGGGVSPFYADIFVRINWANAGRELKGYWGTVIRNENLYGRPGAFQTKRSLRLAPHLTPRGCVFSDNGFQFFAQEQDLLWLLGLTNSSFFESLFRLNVGKDEMPNFMAGVMQLIPVPLADQETKTLIAKEALSAWTNRRRVAIRSEQSPWFSQPFEVAGGLDEVVSFEKSLMEQLEVELDTISKRIDKLALAAYGGVNPISSGHSTRTRPVDGGEEDNDDKAIGTFGQKLFSYLFGLAFGRWAECELKKSPEQGLSSDPFCEIPHVAPGCARTTARLFAVTDESVADGIEQLVRNQMIRLFGRDSESRLIDLLSISSIREYLDKPSAFFSDHLSSYSKSRRKAPIYWPLSTKSGNFTIWVYYPMLDDQSLPKLIADVLSPKIRTLTQEIENRRASPGGKVAELEALRLELEEMRADFLDLINRGYRPNQNDGVLITACPMAKYFRHAGFRKNLEACWKELAGGKYDWAHLAMAMWPDRALEACRKDRSIAIAHGREDLCPAEPLKPARGRKKSLPSP